MDVLSPSYFCFDPLNNLVMSDSKTHSIRVFSPEGNLLHPVGREEPQLGMFHMYHKPQGVAITPNGRFVCLAWDYNCGLQIVH